MQHPPVNEGNNKGDDEGNMEVMSVHEERFKNQLCIKC
jgi:hypothetical protein